MGVWLRKRRLRVWRRSISTLSPSKSMRSLTSSLDQLSRTRSSRSCLSRSRLGPVKEPGSRLLLPLETTMDTLVLVSSAPRRWPPPSEELSSWPSSPSFLSDVVSGEIRSVALTPFLARLLESADQSGRDSSPLPVELASFLLLFLRNCFRWLESTIATHRLVVPLVPLVTSPRPPTLPSPPHTPISPPTSGRRPCSRSRPTRSTLNFSRRPTDLLEFKDRRSSSTRYHHYPRILLEMRNTFIKNYLTCLVQGVPVESRI